MYRQTVEPGTAIPDRPAFEPLSGWQRSAVAVLLGVTVVFGGLVEWRSVVEKQGDLDVYLRAAWAVRAGVDLYGIADDHGWHYNYPPFLAILLVPLADPPPGQDRSGTIPFPVSVALWYAFSVLCLALGTHWLASALERGSSDSRVRAVPLWCRRWWALRVVPVMVCLAPIGATLQRCQVNLLVLALLCGMVAAALRGRRFAAGLWLAGAASIKVFPAFLLLYPLWRRDLRWLAGAALGLVLTLAVLPAAVFGPSGALAQGWRWREVVLLPAFGEGHDQSRIRELFGMTSTTSQSPLAVLHNSLYASLDRAARPPQPAPGTRLTHYLVGGLLTLVTLRAAGGRRSNLAAAEVVFLGLLTLVMLLVIPVSHLHYFSLAVPLVMGLMALEAEAPHRSARPLWVVAAIFLVATTLPFLPGLEPFRDFGLGMYGALLLWLTGVIALARIVRLTALSGIEG
ncbi:MAG: DUF2029 domain-containing protein [Candidatus Methylomirabilis oxyfera]|nr:DUF2029 domain-containing protein [Candidatus Methylomirabilis oxyfera]